MVWDIRTGKSEISICGAHSVKRSKQSASITSLAYGDEEGVRLISCSDKSGPVKLWDLRKSYSGYSRLPVAATCFAGRSGEPLTGISSLAVDGRCFYALCMDGSVYQWHVDAAPHPEPTPVKTFVGGGERSFFSRISVGGPGNSLLASGSKDSNIYLWDVNRQPWLAEDGRDVEVEPLAVLTGHSDEVTCVAWCREPQALARLASCSDDDVRHRLWESVGARWGQDPDESQAEGVVFRGWAERRNANPVPLQLLRGSRPVRLHPDDESEFVTVNKQRSWKKTRNVTRESSPPPPASRATLGLPCSPRKLVLTPSKSPRKLSVAVSPRKRMTANLPNLVRDGNSPHRREVARAKVRRRPSLLAWLNKSEEDENAENSAQVANKRKVTPKSPATPAGKRKRKKK